MRIIFFIIFLCLFPSLSFCGDREDGMLGKKASVYNKELALFYLQQANRKKDSDDLDLAEAHFTKVELFDPELAALHVEEFRKSLSVANWIKKAHTAIYRSEKIMCYQRALKIDPNIVKVHYALGKLFYKDKDYQAAKDSFLKVLSLDETHKKAQRWLDKANRKIQ